MLKVFPLGNDIPVGRSVRMPYPILWKPAAITLTIWLVWQGPRYWREATGAPPDLRLMLAASSPDGHIDALNTALADGASVNARVGLGLTPLMSAAAGGTLESARRLIDLGAQIDATDEFGNTALMMATRNNNVELIRYLLRHGADPNRRDYVGRTAMDLARIFGAHDAVDLLSSLPRPCAYHPIAPMQSSPLQL
jgi:hypothetical protein